MHSFVYFFFCRERINHLELKYCTDEHAVWYCYCSGYAELFKHAKILKLMLSLVLKLFFCCCFHLHLTSSNRWTTSQTLIWNTSPMKIQFFKIIVVIIWDSKRIQAAKNSCAVQTRAGCKFIFRRLHLKPRFEILH